MSELLKQTRLQTMTEKTKAYVWTETDGNTLLNNTVYSEPQATSSNTLTLLKSFYHWHIHLNKVSMCLEDICQVSDNCKLINILSHFNVCNLREAHSCPDFINHIHVVSREKISVSL